YWASSVDPGSKVVRLDEEVKTRHIYDDCNPYWDDEVDIGVYDLNTPIILTVYDKNTFRHDHKMGEAKIDISQYLEYVKADLDPLDPLLTVVDTIEPTDENCLSDDSHIVWKDGNLVQDMVLKLKNVATGEVQIRLQWVNVPGARGLTS
ncbi:hypothetical protein KSS87_011016, partial [Heliosperma pusillum]